jgi:GNAT superfamily N-acetyltransferase
VNIAPLSAGEMPELERFFPRMGLRVPPENVRQFAWPRRPAPGFEMATLGLRDGGSLVGIIGYLDLPLRLRGQEETGRWPINLHLLAEYRGRGLGQRLMEATREGARFRLVIGGNQNSTPVLRKTGWTRIGHLASFRWTSACLRLADRLRPGSRGGPPETVRSDSPAGRAVARRTEVLDGPAPWVDSGESGVSRDARYLRYAFGGDLAPYHLSYRVEVEGEAAGFFVLAARADLRPRLAVEVIDLGAVPGREAAVLEAARRTAFSAGDVVRVHLSAQRFTRAARSLPGRAAETVGLPFWMSAAVEIDPALQDLGSWHITHGDHDRYRALPVSQVWRG